MSHATLRATPSTHDHQTPTITSPATIQHQYPPLPPLPMIPPEMRHTLRCPLSCSSKLARLLSGSPRSAKACLVSTSTSSVDSCSDAITTSESPSFFSAISARVGKLSRESVSGVGGAAVGFSSSCISASNASLNCACACAPSVRHSAMNSPACLESLNNSFGPISAYATAPITNISGVPTLRNPPPPPGPNICGVAARRCNTGVQQRASICRKPILLDVNDCTEHGSIIATPSNASKCMMPRNPL
mmetsp:Transcript_33157/g.74926  ORF Transcript_33157/g.74926 Transcript_33157/m.74926 type:complete len:246 (+) Transcript_33157:825-1562(+)